MGDTQLRADLAHLHRRAGFGATPGELDLDEAVGYEATVARLLSAGPADGAADAIAPPALDTGQTGAQPARRRQDAVDLAGWWLARMAVTEAPLVEKLTFLWHGHFATSVQKVPAPLMLGQNRLLRSRALGRFDELCLAVAQDPAMLVWLDAGTNRRSAPNENFARELFELFTLGLGAFTEADVREAARCFTGWSASRPTGRLRVEPSQHDDGVKTVLGTTGHLEGTDVIGLATHSEASLRFVPSRLWSRLAWPVSPDDPVLGPVVSAYRRNLDVTETVRSILLSPAFRSRPARTGLVKQPVEYVVGTLRALGLTHLAGSAETVAALRLLGQVPFAPPDVGGWPANEAWLTTATAPARLRFAATVAAAADLGAVADMAPVARPEAVASLLGVIPGWGATTAAALAGAAGSPVSLVTAALMAPEYVCN